MGPAAWDAGCMCHVHRLTPLNPGTHSHMCRFAKEHKAAVGGDYRQSAQQWLGTSWQGDALQVSTQRVHHLMNLL